MKAGEVLLPEFLEGKKQFVIPIYQRPYSWRIKQCAQLWDDILRVAQDEKLPSHFIGSIVYIDSRVAQASAVRQLQVIDGQQRLTTISLFLAALGQAIEKAGNGNDIAKANVDYYLFNTLDKGDYHYKLILTQGDKDTLLRLLRGQEPPESASPRIVENFEFFRSRIAEAELPVETIFRGFQKLMIVDVVLERPHDNPQLIFESLNSTGLDLTQADLIRNYVLMDKEHLQQTDLYSRYWHPMESQLSSAEDPKLFDRFMRDYLTMKLKSGTITKLDEVYAGFKLHVRASHGVTTEDLLAEMLRLSKHYGSLVSATHEDPAIASALADLNAVEIAVAYPFLLEAFEDHRQSHINRVELIEILRLVESYAFRRIIASLPSAPLNKVFATMARDVDKANYLESLKAQLQLKEYTLRFPNDQEFKAEFVTKDVYNSRICNYLLSKLENHDRKERVNVGDYTIEHVMPQNPDLPKAWQDALGPEWRVVQSKFLHTIGNLTLTGYNSELSDRPFKDKREIKGGFRESPIRLNKSLGTLERWDEAAIKGRAGELAGLASKMWPAPQVPKEVLDKYRKPEEEGEPARTWTLEDHAQLRGKMLELYQALRARALALHPSVREEIRKYYIAFWSGLNFATVRAKKNWLEIHLPQTPFEEMESPQGKPDDDYGRWPDGSAWFVISSPDQLDYATRLIGRAFELVRADIAA